MAINESFAMASNDFVYGAMAAYAVSMFAFAASFATNRQRTEVSVGTGSGASTWTSTSRWTMSLATVMPCST